MIAQDYLSSACKNCSSVLIGLTTVNSVVTRLLDEWVGKCPDRSVYKMYTVKLYGDYTTQCKP